MNSELSLLSPEDRVCLQGILATLLHEYRRMHKVPDIDSAFASTLLSSASASLQTPPSSTASLHFLASEADPTSSIDPLPYIHQLDWPPESKSSRLIQALLHLCVLQPRNYDSRVRVLLKQLTHYLGEQISWLSVQENKLVLELCKGNKAAATGDHVAQRNRRGRVRRWVGIGAASVLGGGLLVVTGGAAAPALAAGVGALGLGGASAFLGGAGGAAVVASVLGASGAGLTGYRMRRRLSEICHFEFEAVAEVGAISAVVCVPGGVQSEAEIQNVWRFVPDVQPLTDVYNLSWEKETLVNLGNAVWDMVSNKAVGMAIAETLKHTILNAVMAALAWPTMLLSLSEVIDNAWSVAANKSRLAGKILADALISRAHGSRPITLVGYSVGASVIAFALEEMAKCGADVDGIVEDVLLLGAPFTTDKPTWKLIRRVVAGRLVNVYSKNDWLLAFLYRAAEITSSVAGLAPIAVDSVENIDASLLVSDLSDYNRKLKEITEFTGFFDNNRRTSGIHS